MTVEDGCKQDITSGKHANVVALVDRTTCS